MGDNWPITGLATVHPLTPMASWLDINAMHWAQMFQLTTTQINSPALSHITTMPFKETWQLRIYYIVKGDGDLWATLGVNNTKIYKFKCSLLALGWTCIVKKLGLPS